MDKNRLNNDQELINFKNEIKDSEWEIEWFINKSNDINLIIFGPKNGIDCASIFKKINNKWYYFYENQILREYKNIKFLINEWKDEIMHFQHWSKKMDKEIENEEKLKLLIKINLGKIEIHNNDWIAIKDDVEKNNIKYKISKKDDKNINLFVEWENKSKVWNILTTFWSKTMIENKFRQW